MQADNLLSQFATLRPTRRMAARNLGQETNLNTAANRHSQIGRFNHSDMWES